MIRQALRHLGAAIVLLSLTASCSYFGEEQRNLDELNSAISTLETQPQLSLDNLQAINVSLLSEQDYAYYVLLQARVRDKLGANIAELEESVQQAKDLILTEYQPERAAFACFVMGKVYYAKGEQLMALHNFLQAEDWAEKATSSIQGLIYFDIPYNIASLYFREQKYIESLNYTNRALDAIRNKSYSYVNELYALELQALSYQYLEQTSEALALYDEALSIAIRSHDVTAKNRILYNKNTLAYHSQDYAVVEKNSKELLHQALQHTDSVCTGLLYLTLAEVYSKTGKADSSLLLARQAKQLFSSSSADWVKSYLYQTLAHSEQQQGNTRAAAEYRQLLQQLSRQQATRRQAQETEAAVAAEVAKQKGEAAKQALQLTQANRSTYQRLLSSVRVTLVITVGSLLAVLAFGFIRRRLRLRLDHRQCCEEHLLYLSNLRSLHSISGDLEHIDENDYKSSALETIENLHVTLKMSPHFDRTYGPLYYRLRSLYPDFTADELYLYWLINTRTLNLTDLREYMNLSPEAFNRLRQSISQKVQSQSKLSRIARSVLNSFLRRNDDVPLSK